MPARPSDLYLPDTNILVHYIRDDAVKRSIESHYRLLLTDTVPLCNCMIEAETRSIAAFRDWGRVRLDQMEYLFTAFRRVSIEQPDVLRAYVAIDVFSHRVGIDMAKNDLWIAATASVTGATLLTTDKDFDHRDGPFLTRIWIDPAIGKQSQNGSNNDS